MVVDRLEVETVEEIVAIDEILFPWLKEQVSTNTTGRLLDRLLLGRRALTTERWRGTLVTASLARAILDNMHLEDCPIQPVARSRIDEQWATTVDIGTREEVTEIFGICKVIDSFLEGREGYLAPDVPLASVTTVTPGK